MIVMVVVVVVVVAVVDAVQSANPLDLHIAQHQRQDDFQTPRNSLTDYSSGFAFSKAAYQAAKEGDEAVCEPRTPSLKNPPQQPIRACAVLTQPHSQDHPGGVLESSSQCLVAI